MEKKHLPIDSISHLHNSLCFWKKNFRPHCVEVIRKNSICHRPFSSLSSSRLLAQLLFLAKIQFLWYYATVYLATLELCKRNVYIIFCSFEISIVPADIQDVTSELHTVSSDWFQSGLEWILNFEFCLLKLLIFYQKLLWNIRSRLNSFFQILSFLGCIHICLIKIFIFLL